MEKIVQELCYDHKNPLVKLDLPQQKCFCKAPDLENSEAIKKYQNNLEIGLRHNRVERRCARAQAEWQSNKGLAKVTKVKGIVQHFGFQDKNGIFLYPEETLFLLETNRLELKLKEVPVSIQECYNIVINDTGFKLNTYIAYKKLVMQGFRLVRYSEILKKMNKRIKNTQSDTLSENKEKRNIQEEGLVEPKRHCSKSISMQIVDKKSQIQLIEDLFEEFRKKSPKEYISTVNDFFPDYCIFLPTNKSRIDCDFNLVICETVMLSRLNHEKKPTIYAICCDHNISFYKFSSVNLPFLKNTFKT